MMCVKLVYFVGVVMYLGNGMVYAELTQEVKDKFEDAVKPYIKECIEEFGISDEEVEKFKKEGQCKDFDPCFLSCFFKKAGHIDDDGMYDVDKAIEFDDKYLEDDDDKAKMQIAKRDCVKVNAEDVSDGKKGCERAVLLAKCYFEHKEDFD